ncbi:MAG: hypothetical protein HY451_01370 [Parcubacteria group bacterium]|nr:hypothetical protein [Parcubacteria group bacterium]
MNGPITSLPLIAFAVFLVLYSINALFIVYHLFKFGLGYKTKVLGVIFSSGSVLLIFFNYYLFSKIQWAELIYEYLSFPKIL